MYPGLYLLQPVQRKKGGLTLVWFVQINTKQGVKSNRLYMEKRILGIILSIVGILGLILAAVGFMNGGDSTRHIKSIVVYGVLGVIFFFSGIGLVRNTKDKPT